MKYGEIASCLAMTAESKNGLLHYVRNDSIEKTNKNNCSTFLSPILSTIFSTKIFLLSLRRWLVFYSFLSGCELFYNLDPMTFPAGRQYEAVDRYLKLKTNIGFLLVFVLFILIIESTLKGLYSQILIKKVVFTSLHIVV